MRIGIDIRATQNHHRYRGIGVYCRAMLEALAKIDHHNDYVLFTDVNLPDNMSSILSGTDMRYVFADIASKDTNLFLKLKKFFVFDTFDVSAYNLDAFLQPDLFAGRPTGSRKSFAIVHDLIPLIFREHYFNQARRYVRLREFFKYRKGLGSIARYSGVIAISISTRNDLISHKLSSPGKIEVVWQGYTEGYKKDESPWPEIVPEGQRYLLYVGSCDYRKNIVDLVKAFQIAKEGGLVDRLVLVGIDFVEAPPTEIKDLLRNEKAVLLPGYVDNEMLARLYEHAEAFVFPSMYEGFGLPILEAFSYGCPVITYKNSSLEEVGATAAMYANDPYDIIQRLTDLQSDDKMRKKLIDAGYGRLKNFSWETTARKTLDILEKK